MPEPTFQQGDQSFALMKSPLFKCRLHWTFLVRPHQASFEPYTWIFLLSISSQSALYAWTSHFVSFCMCHQKHCHAHTMCMLPAFARVQPSSFFKCPLKGGLMWTPVCTLKLTMPSLALHRFRGQRQLVHITLDKFYRKLKVSSELPCTPKKCSGAVRAKTRPWLWASCSGRLLINSDHLWFFTVHLYPSRQLFLLFATINIVLSSTTPKLLSHDGGSLHTPKASKLWSSHY